MLQTNDIQKKVLDQIRSGGVSMRSRTYFLFRTALLIIAAAIVLAASFYALSFAFFTAHQSGLNYLLEFSEEGLLTFVTLFPWYALLIALALFIILEALLRHFEFGYRVPLIRIFLLILIVGGIGGTLLGLSPLHDNLLTAADNDELPLIGSWYEKIHEPHQDRGIFRGYVSSIAASSFTISHDDGDLDSDDGTWHIIPPSGFDQSKLSIGNKIYIAGKVRNGIVYAYGIHLITDGN